MNIYLNPNKYNIYFNKATKRLWKFLSNDIKAFYNKIYEYHKLFKEYIDNLKEDTKIDAFLDDKEFENKLRTNKLLSDNENILKEEKMIFYEIINNMLQLKYNKVNIKANSPNNLLVSDLKSNFDNCKNLSAETYCNLWNKAPAYLSRLYRELDKRNQLVSFYINNHIKKLNKEKIYKANPRVNGYNIINKHLHEYKNIPFKLPKDKLYKEFEKLPPDKYNKIKNEINTKKNNYNKKKIKLMVLIKYLKED